MSQLVRDRLNWGAPPSRSLEFCLLLKPWSGWRLSPKLLVVTMEWNPGTRAQVLRLLRSSIVLWIYATAYIAFVAYYYTLFHHLKTLSICEFLSRPSAGRFVVAAWAYIEITVLGPLWERSKRELLRSAGHHSCAGKYSNGEEYRTGFHPKKINTDFVAGCDFLKP